MSRSRLGGPAQVVPLLTGWWRDRAKCQGAAPELFDPVTPWRTTHLVGFEATAWKFCRVCPVIVDCADYADTEGETGLWGGAYRRHARDASHVLVDGGPVPGRARPDQVA